MDTVTGAAEVLLQYKILGAFAVLELGAIGYLFRELGRARAQIDLLYEAARGQFEDLHKARVEDYQKTVESMQTALGELTQTLGRLAAGCPRPEGGSSRRAG